LLVISRGDEMQLIDQHGDYVVARDGRRFFAQIYAAPSDGGRWEAWVAFIPERYGPTIATDRETVQADLACVRHWASGLTHIYLEGALQRAIDLGPDAAEGRAVLNADLVRWRAGFAGRPRYS
jgi:hypothetical protein